MNTHHLHLHSTPFLKIQSGTKHIESRLFDEKRQKISIGDILIFTNREDHSTIKKNISDIQIFPTFSELLHSIPIELFGNNTIEAELEALEQYYSPEDQERYGVVALFLE